MPPISPPIRRPLLVLLAAVVGACAPAGSGGVDTAGGPAPEPEFAPEPALPPAPWSETRLSGAAVPAVYRTEWTKAPNRASCALVAPRALGDGAGATARAATYAGGWAVAYDRPGQRSAFGVAGSGTTAEGASYAWPDTLRWADGSVAGYGPEGGSGPNQLAYVQIAGQGCLYNVWSRLGRAHLVALLGELRFVD